jgi:methylated-DNA-[protein]-cysteine S-methyltransferase
MTRHRYDLAGWGSGILWLADGVVLLHEIDWGSFDAGRASAPAPQERPLVEELTARVRRQLAGGRTSYSDVQLDLGWCTPFQAALARTLQSVPWGEVVSYGELAALAGRPGAARAAGSFCAENRFALFLPCHRVVGATGIGGYGEAGIALKRRLLACEGVEL